MCQSAVGVGGGQDLEDDEVEAIWSELHLKSESILVCTVYRPPDSSSSALDRISNMLEIAAGKSKELVLMGDLNCNMLTQNALSEKLLLITQENCLTQMISEPTRVTANSQTLIDVLFTTTPTSFSALGILPLTGSDHMMIFGERVKRPTSIQKASIVRCYKKCNFDELLSELSDTPWHIMDIYSSVDDMWDCWKKLFFSVLDRHAPLRSVRRRKHSLEWIDEEIRQMMRARNYFRTKFRKTGNQEDWMNYKNLKKRVINLTRKAKAEYFTNLVKTIGAHPGKA